MKASEIQNIILEETGIKSSVKKGIGSMKAYMIFSPMFQKGEYPTFPFDFYRKFMRDYPGEYPNETLCSGTQIMVCDVEDDRIKFKKEKKPASVENMKIRQWGSKNSQLRLDKATRRNAVKMKKGGTAGYW